MHGATRYGLNWAKIPTEAEEQKVLELAKDGSHPEQYYPLVNTAAQTGLRICEIIHLKWSDLLPGNMLQVTRRKKRILKPEIVDLFPEFAAFMYEYGKGKKGWMFPGDAAPCIITRRPRFEETLCPDCGQKLLRLDQVRKKCDRVTHFATHLQEKHGRSPDEVAEWIEHVSKIVQEKICDGKHLHIRTAQTRFRMMLIAAGAYVKGRGIHAIRHAFAVQMWKKTKNLMLVKQLLGHEQVTTTQVYATAVDTRERLQEIGRAL